MSPICIAFLVLVSASAPDAIHISPGELHTADFELGEESVWFSIDVGEGGLLAVYAMGSEPDGDLTLAVFGPDYREPQLDSSDLDLMGDTGREKLCALLPGEGIYFIRVGTWGGMTTPFEMVTAFAPCGLDLPMDEDGVSANARVIDPDDFHGPEGLTDALDGGSGDYRDWYRIEPEDDGLLLVSVISATGGDLVLSAHPADEPLESELAYSDSDYDGNYGNERVVLDARRGEALLIQVRGYSPDVSDTYTLRLSFMPLGGDR